MKKTFTMLLTLTAMVFGAKADLLYFMVSAFDWTGPKNFDFAMLGVAKNGDVYWNSGNQTYLSIQPTLDSGASSTLFLNSDEARYDAGPAWADISDYTADGYTFYVETYDNGIDDPIWGYNAETALGYAALLEKGHVYQPGSMLAQDVTPWAVPEPSCGLLLVIGCAFLALRRRRRDEA